MARARIIPVDYYEFTKQLRNAADKGARIEKSQAEKWKAYVEEHKINEIAMHSWGRSKFGGSTPVIINSGSEGEGYYVYSKDEEAALKWVWEGVPESAEKSDEDDKAASDSASDADASSATDTDTDAGG